MYVIELDFYNRALIGGAHLGKYLMEIIGETAYIVGDYGYVSSDDDNEQYEEVDNGESTQELTIWLLLPNDKYYAESMVKYFNLIYYKTFDYLQYSCHLCEYGGDKDGAPIMTEMRFNINENKEKFSRYILPLIKFEDDYIICSKRVMSRYYMISDGRGGGDDKWQIFFNSHVYKIYVFFRLLNLEYFMTDKLHGYKIKTDFCSCEWTPEFNRDLICIYVSKGEWDEDEVKEFFKTTYTVFEHLEKIKLDFSLLRIDKILFREGRYTGLERVGKRISKDEVLGEYLRIFGDDDVEGAMRAYNDSKTPYENYTRLRTTFTMEAGKDYKPIEKISFYDDYELPLTYKLIRLGGGGSNEILKRVLLFICMVVVMIVVVVLITKIFNSSQQLPSSQLQL